MSAVEIAVAALREFGAEFVRLDVKHKHPRVYFRHGGREQFYACSGTSSDWRIGGNIRSDLRHMLGLVETEKRVGKRRTRRWRAPAPPVEVPVISGGPNHLRGLRSHPLYTEAVWRDFWHACMDTTGAPFIWPWNGERLAKEK